MQTNTGWIVRGVCLAVVAVAVVASFCLGGCSRAPGPLTVDVESRLCNHPNHMGKAFDYGTVGERLMASIDAVDFQDAPLEQVFHWLSNAADLRMKVEWDELEAFGLTRDTPVTLQLQCGHCGQRGHGSSPMLVLWKLQNAVVESAPLRYIVADNQLVVSTWPYLVAHRRMERRVAVVDLQEMPLEDAFRRMGSAAGMKVEVNWAALEEAGLSKETPLTLQLTDVSLRQMFTAALDTLGGPTPLAYDVEYERNPRIYISTREELGSEVCLRVYHVNDLVGYNATYDDAVGRVAALKEQITRQVEPGTWRRENGGGPGTIAATGEWGSTHLVVRQTRLAHRQVLDLLNALRAEAEDHAADAAREKQAARDAYRGRVVRDSHPLNGLVVSNMLTHTLASAHLNDEPLSKVLGYMGFAVGFSMTVHWDELKTAGVTQDTAVTIHLVNENLDTVLTQILATAGSGTTPLAYVIVDGKVIISTQPDLDKRYPVDVSATTDKKQLAGISPIR